MIKIFGEKAILIKKRATKIHECRDKCIGVSILKKDSASVCKAIHKEIHKTLDNYSNCPGLYVTGITYLKIRRF